MHYLGIVHIHHLMTPPFVDCAVPSITLRTGFVRGKQGRDCRAPKGLAMTFVNRFLGKLEMTNRRSSALLFI